MRLDYIKIILAYWIIGWSILLAGRLGLIALFVQTSEIFSQSQFLGLAVWNALRFDFQTLAYIAVVPTIVFLIASHFRSANWTNTFARYYYSILYTLVVTLTVCDLGFYKNFNSHFNIVVFDFFNEGPATLLQTFWEEYPVVWMCMAIIVVFVLIYKLVFSFSKTRRSYVVAATWVAFVVISMRGSVVEFPLQVEDMYVSPSQQFNDCVPNAIYSLKKAWSDKSKAFSIQSDDELLVQFGFSSVDEAWAELGYEGKELFSCVKDTVSGQPDVVIIISESWSGYFCRMGLDRTDANLLCGMRRHLDEDMLLHNYQSIHNGTIATIENLIISTSFPRVFTSKYRYVKFPTSFATPFIQSGYEVTFMSGMDEGWENVGTAIKNQGFNNVFKYELLKEHPEYEYNSVGIYDHHLMNSLFEHLMQPSSKPRLFVVMTTTNHPPFVYPDDAQLPALPNTLYDDPAFANKKDVQEKYIQGFQYANYSMASFLDRFKSSSASDNTVVVITGDHNVRTALEYGNQKGQVEEKWRYRVPFYLYLPPAMRGTENNTYDYDPELYGCHYDILPTIAPLAFRPGVRYLNIGQNLLADSLTRYNTYSYNVESIQADDSCVFNACRKAYARELLLRQYLQSFLSTKKQ